MTTTTDADDLVTKAQKQLDEHKTWLRLEIGKIAMSTTDSVTLMYQAGEIRLRVAKVSQVVTVVWEYPDELIAFLRSDLAPKHLRDTLAGGHVVDPNQPAWSARRVHDEG